METAPLRSFATWARAELITQVTARIAAVLAPASSERTENPRAIRVLEADIRKAGGEAKGKETVADKVAYTWFNRIIALRFMDASGYTNAGVVSPAAGQIVGQPEVLADAKRGTFDHDVVNAKIVKDVTGLLDGTRPSTDPQGEAYTLLLAEYSRFWNKSMPFMFEREGDYTELLIPSNLLADESILARAVNTMTSAVCEDVEVIGWLYQFYISERKDEVFAGFKKNKKADAEEIPAATQLFTPHWIVRYLVENSVGRLWMLNHPESRLVDQMDYYIAPADEETDYLKLAGPEDLTVIDPACGSAHMLTYAFDLLYAIYEEEGYSPSEIPVLILTHNLYGAEIDPRAGALAAFALTMKARSRQRTFFSRHIAPKVCVIEPMIFRPDELDYLFTPAGDKDAEGAFWNQFSEADAFGSLIKPDPNLTNQLASHINSMEDNGDILHDYALSSARKAIRQASFLAARYAVLVANPPYMGKRNMAPRVSEHLSRAFPEAAADLYLAFFIRCMDLLMPGGFVGQVAMRGWLHASAQGRLRRKLLTCHTIEALMPMDSKVMPIDFETAAVVWRTHVISDKQSVAIHHVRRSDLNQINLLEPSRFRQIGSYSSPSREYLRNEAAEVLFDLESYELRLMTDRPSLRNVSCKVGLQTGDVPRYVRYWHEVSASRIARSATDDQRWAPYAKAGGARRWYGFTDCVVDWASDGSRIKSNPSARPQGAENYWRVGLEWSDIGHYDLAARLRPEGYIFDVVAMSLFVDGDDEERLYGVLAYLNSSVVGNLMNSLSSGMHYSVGYIARLPEPGEVPKVVIEASKESTLISMNDWNQKETSRAFCSDATLQVPARTESRLIDVAAAVVDAKSADGERLLVNERLIDEYFARDAGVLNEIRPDRRIESISIASSSSLVADLLSYAVGCMFGRYSLDVSGLVLADQGSTLEDYLAKVPEPTFAPDGDNVLPIVDGDWFEDDIVSRFRQFLRVSFGEKHFEDNLRFVEESLGVKSLRDYFISRGGKSKFYIEHVKRYKKRPIYWMFSSAKGSFNALIYMHRYNPSTVSTVLNDYLREYEAKLGASLENLERETNGESTPRQRAAAAKEVERLRKILVELSEYEHEVMYPLASEQIAIDLDDGVKVNYPKFGSALRKIQGL